MGSAAVHKSIMLHLNQSQDIQNVCRYSLNK